MKHHLLQPRIAAKKPHFDGLFRLGLRRSADQEGVALLVVLAVLSIILVILVAFANSVRVERIASRTHTDLLRARLSAISGTEEALYRLKLATSQKDYATGMTNVLGVPMAVAYSGAPGGAPTNLVSLSITNGAGFPNFNAQGLLYPVSMVPNVSVGWLWISNSFSGNPLTSTNARYAYWVDDESSKINVNAAGNTNGASSTHTRVGVYNPSSIDLTALPTINSALAQTIVQNRPPPYETLFSVMEIGVSNVFASGFASFATVSSGDYEVQTNGLNRINLNDVVTNNTPAVAVQIIHDAINAAYPTYKQRFTSTAPPDGDGAIYQLAANIVDYIDPDIYPTDQDPTDYSGTKYFGREMVPYLNEIKQQIVISTSAVSPYTVKIAVTNYTEVFNLFNTPFTQNTQIKWNIPTINVGGSAIPNPGPITSVAGGTVPAFSSGGIAVYTNTYSQDLPGTYLAAPYVDVPYTPQSLTYTYYDTASGKRFDYAVPGPLPYAGNTAIAGSAAVIEIDAQAIDPRFNHTPTQATPSSYPWIITSLAGTGTGTIGSQNSFPAPISSTWGNNIQNNGDSNNVATVTMDGGFPFANGPIKSVGEIGNIPIPGGAPYNSTPYYWAQPCYYYRTLKLYGDGNALSGQVPDWALLDVFTVTNAGGKVDGKINVNTQRDALVNYTNGALQGLLLGLKRYSTDTPLDQTSARAIALDIGANFPYRHIGEIGSKVPSLVSNAGQTTDERKEALIRALSGIVTTRGNQFTIYCMGQSIEGGSLSGKGQTNVLGEVFMQTIVERSTNNSYRVKYQRFLTE